MPALSSQLVSKGVVQKHEAAQRRRMCADVLTHLLGTFQILHQISVQSSSASPSHLRGPGPKKPCLNIPPFPLICRRQTILTWQTRKTVPELPSLLAVNCPLVLRTVQGMNRPVPGLANCVRFAFEVKFVLSGFRSLLLHFSHPSFSKGNLLLLYFISSCLPSPHLSPAALL